MKINHKFTVYGNQEELEGNPIPYTRVTQKQKFSKKHPNKQWERYQGYKEYVASDFVESLPCGELRNQCSFSLYALKRPINTKRLHRVEVTIYYVNLKSKKRGDPENIRKGILDALFVDDLEVIGGVPMRYEDKDNPRVEITITYIEE